MHRGVQQGRVQAEPGGLDPRLFGQRDLGEDLVAASPGSAQALEHRAVAVAPLDQALVGAFDVDFSGAGGRPGREVEVRGGRRGGGERAGGVPRPGVLGRVALGTGVDVDRAGARRVGAPDDHLERDTAALGQDQRRLQGQFLQHAAADVVPGADRQLHEPGAGQQDRAEDVVVRQPGLGVGGKAAGQHHGVGAGRGDHGAQHRVPRRLQSGESEVTACGTARVQPVAALLEGVGGQVDVALAVAREEGGPVDLDAACVDRADPGDQLALLAAVLAQEGEEGDIGVAGDTLLAQPGEDAIGSELDEGRDPLGLQGADAVGEADRPTDVPHPVIGIADLCRRGQAPGHGGCQGDRRCAEGQSLGEPAELLQHRLHQRRVEGVGDRQAAGLATLALEALGDLEDFFFLAGDQK